MPVKAKKLLNFFSKHSKGRKSRSISTKKLLEWESKAGGMNKGAAYGDTEPLYMDQNVGKVDYESKVPVKLNPRPAAPDTRKGDVPTGNVSGIGAREEDGRNNATTLSMGTSTSTGDIVPDALPQNYKLSFSLKAFASSMGQAAHSGKVRTKRALERKKDKEKESCIAELNKMGAISDEEAKRALEQLDTLEKAKPGVAQVGRYALVGSVAGPTVSIAREMLRKGPKAGVARYFKDVIEAEKKGVLPYVRHAAGDATAGAITSGAIPLLRASLDRVAAERKLKEYLRENAPQMSAGPSAPKLASLKEWWQGGAGEKFWSGVRQDIGPAVGSVIGAGTASAFDISPVAGAALGYGIGAIPEITSAVGRRLAGEKAALHDLPHVAPPDLGKNAGAIWDFLGHTLRKPVLEGVLPDKFLVEPYREMQTSSPSPSQPGAAPAAPPRTPGQVRLNPNYGKVTKSVGVATPVGKPPAAATAAPIPARVPLPIRK